MIKPEQRNLSHWANITFLLILFALVMVWIIFPPHHAKVLDMSNLRGEATSIQRG